MIVAGLVLALAVVIDDAVGDVRTSRGACGATADERRAELGHHGRPRGVARDAERCLYASLISLVVFVPVFFLGVRSARSSRRSRSSYAMAVVASMIVA